MAIKSWSTTAASNVNALTGVGLGFDESQAPSLVNNAARELMAQVAAMVADAYSGLCPYYAGAGTANAHTITVNPAIAAYASGQMFVIKWGATNTGATTLNANALGTKAIQYAGTALKGGEIVSGRIGVVVYDGTQFELLTPFVLHVQDTTNKHLGIGSGVFANGTGGTTEANLAIGQGALPALTTGYGHVAIGVDAGKLISSGTDCTAVGYTALDASSTASNNTAVGFSALGAATGATNTAIGSRAGAATTSGGSNTFVGFDAGYGNPTTGGFNTILGGSADGAATSTASAVVVGYGASAATAGIAIGRGATAAANKLALGSATYNLTTQSTIGANGAASALTANPLGYLVIDLNDTEVIIPYYTK